MLKKIIKVKNVGKLVDYSAAGDVEFRKLTLFYAENGRGKTTLCDILRSLQTGLGDYIDGRQTLGSRDNAEVSIRLDNSTATYKDGAWISSYPDIAIFDSTFVHENVFAGDYVDHDHKKNLYRA